MLTTKDLLEHFETARDGHHDRWQKFLAFPSISTKPEHDPDCLACLDWLKGQCEKLGFTCEKLETSGKPVLLAKRPGQGDGLLVYGHYDVQPPEPIEQWKTPPFTPSIREGRLYARGAQDNKGQVSYILAALQTLIEAKALHMPVTLLIEGEEEVGSHGLEGILQSLSSKVEAKTLLVCDTGTPSPEIGAIVLGLRGIASLELTMKGPNKDLHSGLHGGLCPNIGVIAARLVAGFHDERGRVSVPGFYDELTEVSDELRQAVQAFPLDEKQYQERIGVAPIGGEQAYSLAERMSLRPTLEINGIENGYTGKGMKTVIGAEAVVKISLRLVPDQDPERTLAAVEKHVQDFFLPFQASGISVEVTYRERGGRALRVPLNDPLIAISKQILQDDLGLKALPMWFGASIPIIPSLAQATKTSPIMVGFGLEEDAIHAPNESFSLEQFQKGYLFVARLMQKLQEQG